MPNSCCAVGCTNHNMMKRKISFFTFPKDEERWEKWVNAVKRINSDGTKWAPTKYTVLCGDHFLQGKPCSDASHPDYVPSVFQHKATTPKESANKLKRFASAVKRKIGFESPTPAKRRVIQYDTSPQFIATPIYDILCESVNKENVCENDQRGCTQEEKQQLLTEIENLRKEKTDLKTENEQLSIQLNAATLCHEFVKENDEKCKFYTGLPWGTFWTTYIFLSNFVQVSSQLCRKIKTEDQFFFTLVKLRHDLPFEMLANIKNISSSSVSKLFWNWLNLLHAKLGFLIKWPERETLITTLPGIFKSKFPRLTSIIDCFEIFIERPKNLKARAKCYSNYKKHSTVKVFIACTANGSISFLSCTWGGRVSDVEIVRSSGFISNKYHLPGDQILADRGFTLQDDFATICSAELIIPAFTKGKKQLSAQEVEVSRKISSVRIHIERVIGLIKQRFKILQGTLPVLLIKSLNDEADSEELARIDKLIKTCAILVNLGDGIVYNENE